MLAHRSETGLGSLGAGIIGICEPPDVGAGMLRGSNSSPLQSSKHS